MKLTLTQKAYNQVAKRIEEVKQLEINAYGKNYFMVKNTRKALEAKLMEISRELTAERYAENY